MTQKSSPWDISKLKQTIIDDVDDDIIQSSQLGFILDVNEAERYVETLKKFQIEEIGNSEWMEQHRKIEKLNLQAHQSALSNSDEFILEAIITFDKLDVLINELLIIEIWKENIYNLLLELLAGRNTMRTYFILYHEAILVNFFEIILFHKHVCENGGEKLIELVDYVARKLTKLNSGYDFRAHEFSALDKSLSAKDYAKAIESRNPVDEIQQHFYDIEFKVCVSSVAIARLLSEHADVLPLSCVSRITDTHDYLILLLPLIENPPWTRRIKSTGKWQKLINQSWQDVAPIDLLKVTKLEGQPWISLFHLLGKQVIRERYHLNSFRKAQLLRVRKYINDVMLDQLPFLADIQRYMDELAISEINEPHSLSSGSVFMFQQIAIVREKLIKGKNWESIAEFQWENVFTMTDKTDADLKKLAEIYSDEVVETIFDSNSSI